MRTLGYDRLARAARLGLAFAAAVGVWLALASGPALAVVTHKLVSTLDGSDQPGGSFFFVMNAAVDNSGGPSSGDVYVGGMLQSDFSTVIGKFTADGVYADVQIGETPQGPLSFIAEGFFTGIAVDGSAGINRGDLYVADVEHGVVDKFNETGEYVCQITGIEAPSLSECAGVAGSKTPDGSMTPRDVVVDSSGDVYVSDVAHDVVDEFGPSGEYLGQIKDPHVSMPGALALDSSGDLYVVDGTPGAPGAIVKFAGGSFAGELGGGEALTVAVDPAEDHVFVGERFVGEGDRTSEYDASGTKLDTFGHAGFALAVGGATGRVYTNHQSFAAPLDIYGPRVVLAEAVTGAATSVGETSATFNGRVEPDLANGGGDAIACQFEYVTDKQFQEHEWGGASTVPCAPATPYSSTTSVSANVTALLGSTTYHFRLSATDAEGTYEGAEETFITPGPPTVGSQSVVAIVTSAEVSGQINPFGFDTTCRVQYVSDADFGLSGYANASSVPCAADLGAGFGEQAASATLTGLKVATAYHFRFLATNQAGTTTGADETFTTFGVKSFAVEALDAEGKPDTQAGSHPYKLVTSFDLNTSARGTDANAKDIQTELPPGILGNVNAMPRCTRAELRSQRCSGAAQVGTMTLRLDSEVDELPLYNLVPPTGIPAEFGLNVSYRTNLYIDANVRADGDYGITAGVPNATTAAGLRGTTVELWGVPADPSHDAQRACPQLPRYNGEIGPCAAGVAPRPFLTNPTSCSGPRTATLRVNSWQDPGDFVTATSAMPAVTGCEQLGFAPSIAMRPDSAAADSPSGGLVELGVPQEEASDKLASAQLRNAAITLPPGMTLNPAAADGLQACSQAQFGLNDGVQPACPDASKVGTVEIDTPLLADKVTGSAYLAEQGNNPFGSTFALYVAAQADGAMVKVAVKVQADPLTGQVTASWRESPQLPFGDLRMHLFGGPRASLATPATCGTYTTTALLTPWSALEAASPVAVSSPFQIATGPGGAPCAPPAFAPAFSAGSRDPQAGGFSPFVLSLSRSDGEQGLSGVTVTTPPGFSGILRGVERCPEPQASQGTCGAGSLIGHTAAAAGAGPAPFWVQGGQVFLTGPYAGAPFGLSIVVPAVAGPFDLGNVVVRAAIHVDPHTAQIVVVSDPLPSILDGVPLRIRSVHVILDRPGFAFNPTNCAPLAVTGTVTSTAGARADVSSRFQAANCAALAFHPVFSVSTRARTSKRGGASLTVKATFPAGKQANIRSVAVVLPKQLPARLTTIQQACTAAAFAADPASCPAGSQIGTATATTPILAAPLTGTAYLVSHGGAAFPDLVIVFHGEGIRVDLVGNISIKQGVTSSVFATIPDAPISSFQLTLPQGPHSGLAAVLPAKARGNMCGQKLTMPFTITGQNGAQLEQSAKIAVSGCPKATQRAHGKKKHKAKKRHKRTRKHKLA